MSRCFISFSAPCLVRRKTIERPSGLSVRIFFSISVLAFWPATKCTYCSTLSAALPGGETSTLTGSVRKLAARSAIAFGMVAENSQGLALGRNHLRDLAQVVDEAEVEHLVGLVEHQIGDGAQRDGVTGDQVEQAARGGDEDVGALFELQLLLADRGAADDLVDPQRGLLDEGAQVVADLVHQFAGRGEDQGAGGAVVGDASGWRAASRSAAGRRLPSCRCRSGRDRSGRGRTAQPGYPSPGSGSGFRNRWLRRWRQCSWTGQAHESWSILIPFRGATRHRAKSRPAICLPRSVKNPA